MQKGTNPFGAKIFLFHGTSLKTMNLDPIGMIHSGYKEKFGIPRQPGLVKSATAALELLPPYTVEEALFTPR